MLGRIWSSRWHIAATVLAVAECASVASIETVLPTAAQAQSSGEQHFRHSRGRPDNFFQDLIGSRNWKRRQQKPHQSSDSSRASPGLRAKSKPEQSEPAASKKAVGTPTATVESVPLPRPRPPSWPEPHSFAEAAGPGFDSANVTSDWRQSPRSNCCRGSSVQATAAAAI